MYVFRRSCRFCAKTEQNGHENRQLSALGDIDAKSELFLLTDAFIARLMLHRLGSLVPLLAYSSHLAAS